MKIGYGKLRLTYLVTLSIVLLLSYYVLSKPPAIPQQNQSYAWIIVPFLTLSYVFLTRNAAVSLALGSIFGVIALSKGDLGDSFKLLFETHLFGAISGPWHIGAILFTLILGAFAGVLQSGGGFSALAEKIIGSKKSSARRTEAAVASLGLLCFFDGLANSLLVGRVARPLFDRAQITRARLAYIVDSTGSAVACLAIISTWIAAQLSYIQDGLVDTGIQTSAYELFFKSIPWNFYCWFTIVLVFATIWRQWQIGPMRKSLPNTEDEGALSENSHDQSGSIWSAIIPLLILITSIVCSFYLWDTTDPWPITSEKMTAAFGGNAGPYALTLGSLIGLVAAICCVPRHQLKKSIHGAKKGAGELLGPIVILILAWTFGSTIRDLGTAQYLAQSIQGLISPELFPLGVFFLGLGISFMTGSSWGTMGLLMPLAMGTWLHLMPGDPTGALPAVIGAVFSGAVFGDHCSPFSDTTIVSSFSSGISTHEHVTTQLPYALATAAFSAVFGFGLAALGLHPALALLSGALAIVGTITVLSRKQS